MKQFDLTLADLLPGQTAEIVEVDSDDGAFKRRLASLGVIPGHVVSLDRSAPLGDPRIYSVMGYSLGLRNTEAQTVHLHLT